MTQLYTITPVGSVAERHVISIEGSPLRHIAATLYYQGGPVVTACGMQSLATSRAGGAVSCEDCLASESLAICNASPGVRGMVQRYNLSVTKGRGIGEKPP